MKATAVVLCALALVSLVGDFMLAKWAGMPGGPVTVFGIVFQNLDIILRLIVMLLFVFLAVTVLISANLILARPRSPPSQLLIIFAFLPILLGFAATAFGCLTVYEAMLNTHTTRLFVIAPSLAEALLPLCVGVFVGALAASGNAVLYARMQKLPSGT